jgi:hypothetical protein
MATPLSKNLLGWGNLENGMLFVGIGITAVVGYVATMVIQNCFNFVIINLIPSKLIPKTLK